MSRTGETHLDQGDDKASEALKRLETERAGWLTTVGPDGTPQSSPVWFIWDDGEIYLYSKRSPRVRNIAQNPRISFNLDGNRLGGKVLVLEGTAAFDGSAPTAAENPEYLEKYGPVMEERDWAAEWFAERYPVFIRITPSRFRYW